MNKKVLGYILCSSIICCGVAVAQKPTHPAKTYVSQGGSIFWNKSLPVYLKIAPSPDGAGILLKNNQQKQYTNPIYFDTEGVNYIRTRHAVDHETKEVKMPLQEIMLPVYADSKPPVSRAHYMHAPMHKANAITYIGKGLALKLSSVDAMSGVEEVYYATNSENYLKYSEAIPFDQEREYVVKYYGVDRVGNDEEVQEEQFITDFHSPTTTHLIEGNAIDHVYSFGAQLSFAASDSLSGVKSVYYKLDEGNFQQYNGGKIDINDLEDGDHTLQYYAVDHVNNQEMTRSFSFFFDKTAPLVATDILGDRFIVEDQIYFSGRTKLKFTAVDNKVGVKEIQYSINGGEYIAYDQPFYLPSTSGTHTIHYYAVDNLLNKTIDKKTATGIHQFEHQATKVYVDLIGPSLSHDVEGVSLFTRDTLFINPTTKIILQGDDAESGLQKITYSLEGSPEEFDYQEALLLESSGYHAIDFYGYDNVNNRNLSHLHVFVDNQGPEIFHYFSSEPYGITADGLPIYSRQASIYLAATDDHVGLQQITYQIDNGKEEEYIQKIRSLRKNKAHSLLIKAVDVLGNEKTKRVDFFIRK